MVDPYRVPAQPDAMSEAVRADRADCVIAAVLFASGATYSLLVLANGEAFGVQATIALFVALEAACSLLWPLLHARRRSRRS